MDDIIKLHKDYHNYSVLYVEDDKNVRKQTVYFLTKFFDNVDEAADGEEGLSMFKKNNYDIIISDLKMPKIGGKEMLKTIRAQNSEIILIITTANNLDINDSEIIYDYYLNKPASIGDFIKAFEFLREKLPIL